MTVTAAKARLSAGPNATEIDRRRKPLAPTCSSTASKGINLWQNGSGIARKGSVCPDREAAEHEADDVLRAEPGEGQQPAGQVQRHGDERDAEGPEEAPRHCAACRSVPRCTATNGATLSSTSNPQGACRMISLQHAAGSVCVCVWEGVAV